MGVAVLGELAGRGDDGCGPGPGRSPTLLCNQGRAEVTGLVGPIGHDGFAEVKCALVSADALNLHFVAELAFGRVELPFADEGVIRRPQRALKSQSTSSNRKVRFDMESSLADGFLPGVLLPAACF